MDMQQHIRDDDFSEIAHEFNNTLTLKQQDVVVEDDEDDDDDGNFEFSFAGSELHSPVSAEEVFQNGQIRPLFQISDEIQAGNSEDTTTTSYDTPSVRKVFLVSSSTTPANGDVAEGPYYDWPEKSTDNSERAPEMRRKSNSTGLSKLWRVKDLLVRSHSDGKDAFVFLNRKSCDKAAEETASSGDGKKGDLASKTASSGKKKKKSAYEELYGKKEKKAGKSYLPYRQDLVGFFTNSNAITKNVHPY